MSYLIKYSKERVESYIKYNAPIKLIRQPFENNLQLIRELYYPDGDMKNFKCIINEDTKTLKYIIIEYYRYNSHSGYQYKEINIYENKIYIDNYEEPSYKFKVRELNELNQKVHDECYSMFRILNEEIKHYLH